MGKNKKKRKAKKHPRTPPKDESTLTQSNETLPTQSGEDRATQNGEVQPTQSDDAHPMQGQSVVVHEQFSGPLPPPVTLEHYERTLPGCADRIVTMAEKMGTHEREQSGVLAQAHTKEIARGQWMVYTLALAAIGAGVYLTLEVGEVAGSIFGALGVAFFLSRTIGKVISFLSRREG